MTTYQVFCKGTARRWLPYSGAPISYKIVKHTRQDVA